MSLKKFVTVMAGISLATAAAGVAAGPSAKFAATWTTEPVLASVADTEGYVTGDTVITASHTGYALATIKIPQGKEALVGISAEIGIVTDTSIKGKDGGSAKALAGGKAYVDVFAVPTGTYDPLVTPVIAAAPGQVMLSERVQELSATLGGVIQTCEDTTGGTDENGLNPGDEGYVDTPDGVIDVALECLVTDEEIGLMQDTTAAHHFNFVFADLEADEYDIVAVFSTGARVDVNICDSDQDYCGDMYDPDGTVSASAYAKAVINKTMVTVQEVRAVKGGAAAGTIEIVE